MHILIALTYYRPHYSGLTIYTERVARALVERGHQVTVLTSRFDDNLPEREMRDGVEIIRCKVWFRVSKGVIMPGIWQQAWRLIRQADIIHLHVPQLDAAPIALVGRLRGKPVVLTYHCDLHLPRGAVHWIANQVSNLANHVTASAANLIVLNSMDYAEHSTFLRGYLPKVRPIHPPIDLTPIQPGRQEEFCRKYDIHPDERIIGMLARLASEKGVEYLAQALPAVLKKHPQARVLFVGAYQNVMGEEAYAERLRPLIEALGSHWSFLGILSPEEKTAFFDRCEVTVLPSINSTESYGIVQVESMACGTPVVASDLPGVRVPVQESGMGRIVPPADAQKLAQALIDILDNPQAYRGDPQGNAQRLVEISTPEALGAAYEAVFAGLTGASLGNNLTNHKIKQIEN